MEPKISVDAVDKINTSPMQRIEPIFPGRPARTLVTILTYECCHLQVPEFIFVFKLFSGLL
jgi:hypothetical protein